MSKPVDRSAFKRGDIVRRSDGVLKYGTIISIGHERMTVLWSSNKRERFIRRQWYHLTRFGDGHAEDEARAAFSAECRAHRDREESARKMRVERLNEKLEEARAGARQESTRSAGECVRLAEQLKRVHDLLTAVEMSLDMSVPLSEIVQAVADAAVRLVAAAARHDAYQLVEESP